MGNLIDLAGRRKRPESPMRTYVETAGVPFVNQEPVNPSTPEKPHPVYHAARAVALARMATADLTHCQRREALLKSASMLATCPQMRRVWQNKADQIALSIRGAFAPLEETPVWIGYDPGTGDIETAFIVPAEHKTLWPWLLVLASVALAIVVTPPFCVS